MKNLRLIDVPERVIREAVKASGVDAADEDYIVADFTSDPYWNDPKCAGRRITVCNGDRIAFFDYLDGVDWGEGN